MEATWLQTVFRISSNGKIMEFRLKTWKMLRILETFNVPTLISFVVFTILHVRVKNLAFGVNGGHLIIKQISCKNYGIFVKVKNWEPL